MPEPLAMRYHGHQFRVYNPELGDGRGFLFAQLREAGTGRLLDLGTKGSGQTPWSRTGRRAADAEGRGARGAGHRHAGGAGRADLALVLADRDRRGRWSAATSPARPARRCWRGCRTATSASAPSSATPIFERADLIAPLIDHVVENYYPELAGAERPARAPALLQAVVGRAGAADRALDGGRLRARRAQHRQHEHHRRELRLRPLPLPAAQRPELHRRLFRPDRPLQPSAASRRRCSGTCSSWPAPAAWSPTTDAAGRGAERLRRRLSRAR